MKYKIEKTTNVDNYANVCRDWRIVFDSPYIENDLLVVHSGTDGVSIATRGCNNSFVRLDEEAVKSLIKELQNSIKFSSAAKADMAAYWDIKNEDYIGTMKKKFE